MEFPVWSLCYSPLFTIAFHVWSLCYSPLFTMAFPVWSLCYSPLFIAVWLITIVRIGEGLRITRHVLALPMDEIMLEFLVVFYIFV